MELSCDRKMSSDKMKLSCARKTSTDKLKLLCARKTSSDKMELSCDRKMSSDKMKLSWAKQEHRVLESRKGGQGLVEMLDWDCLVINNTSGLTEDS